MCRLRPLNGTKERRSKDFVIITVFQALWANVFVFQILTWSHFFNWLEWFSAASLQAGKPKGPTREGWVANSIEKKCPLWFYVIPEMPANPALLIHFTSSPPLWTSAPLLSLAAMFTWEGNQLLKDLGTAFMSALQKQSELLPLPGFLEKSQPSHLPYSPAQHFNISFYRTLCFRYSITKGPVEEIKYMVKGLTKGILGLL